MRCRAQHGLILVVGLELMACQVHALRHNQHVAAAKAEEFLQHAVIEQDFRAAHLMLREDARSRISEATLADAIKKQHPGSYPKSIRATEYEPVPGQAAIQIFLNGGGASEQFYYRVPLVGTVETGYSPDGIYRGNMPYPESPLRKRLE